MIHPAIVVFIFSTLPLISCEDGNLGRTTGLSGTGARRCVGLLGIKFSELNIMLNKTTEKYTGTPRKRKKSTEHHILGSGYNSPSSICLAGGDVLVITPVRKWVWIRTWFYTCLDHHYDAILGNVMLLEH